MKKLLTLTTIIFALLIGAEAINAKPQKKKKHQAPVSNYYADIDNGYYNRRGVYIYHTTRTVRRWNGRYRNTYRHKIFPNGRKNTRLISSVKLRHYRYGHGRVRVFYRTKTVYRNWKAYRVTYKIKKFPNGRVKRKVVKVRRIYAY